MRERIAQILSIAMVAIVVALSLLFASAHNIPVSKDVVPSKGSIAIQLGGPKDIGADILEQGRVVYDKLNCAACHSIAGDGNPRYPLDSVGVHLNAAELRPWITGTGIAVDSLSPGVVRRKQRYQSTSGSELDALVQYLSTLRFAK